MWEIIQFVFIVLACSTILSFVTLLFLKTIFGYADFDLFVTGFLAPIVVLALSSILVFWLPVTWEDGLTAGFSYRSVLALGVICVFAIYKSIQNNGGFFAYFTMAASSYVGTILILKNL